MEEESTKPSPAKKPRFQQKSEDISKTNTSNKNDWGNVRALTTYFKQFQRQFNFQIVEEKPTFFNTNVYAVCAHFDSEFCS